MDESEATPTLDPGTWVDAYGDFLYRFALARVRNPETAEDLVQDALLAGLTARHAFRGQSSERSWLVSILKRKVADWLRHAVRRGAEREPRSDKSTDALFTTDGKWKKKPDDWSTDAPGLEMNRAEFRLVLEDCLGKLPPRLFDAFVFRYVAEHSTDDVCKAVGVKPTNLWVMLHRARMRLWQCLSVNWFEDESKERSEG